MVIDMPIIRPGSVDTGSKSYSEYLEGVQQYFSSKDDSSRDVKPIKRGYTLRSDRQARVKAAREARERKLAAGELESIDIREYEEAEAARPVLEGLGGWEYQQKLSDWVSKYKDVWGRGESRYQRESSYIESQEEAAKGKISQEETGKYNVGRNVSNILSDPKYKVVERYDTGEVKKVIQTPEKYLKKEGHKFYKGKDYGEYIPYEAEFTKEGKLKKELSRDIKLMDWRAGTKSGWKYEYEPVIKGVLEYEDGKPKELIGKDTYISKRYTSPTGSRTYAIYTPYEKSKVLFGDEGEVKKKEEFDVGRSSWMASGESGGTLKEKPYMSKLYDLTANTLTTYGKPGYESYSKGMYSLKPYDVKRKEVEWYNPYTGKGKTSTGVFYQTSGPKITSIKGPSMAVESPKTGKFISENINPWTGKYFKSEQEKEAYNKSREAMIGSTIMKQELWGNIKKSGYTIPKELWGTSSAEFGEVSPEGKIVKTPSILKYKENTWI